MMAVAMLMELLLVTMARPQTAMLVINGLGLMMTWA